ncbi:hypothetical protein AB0H42_24220 [Nocardia sp. NPDC050799]|uniref:hypothetical protein n=1 Tax=Nocardia sp. NPDC050799 TaxID=3154842 RepID=UPI0033C98264
MGGFETVLGTGAMINWLTVENTDVPLFDDWYSYEHLPERVSTPGFRRARRFVASHPVSDTSTDFLTVYETDDVDVLSSAPYLAKLNTPTELTRRVVPLFKEFRRCAARTTAVFGAGSTGRVLAAELDPAADRAALRATVPRLIAEHRLHAGSLYEPDAAVSAAKSATAEGRDTASQQHAESALLLLEPHTGVGPQDLAADLPTIAREFELVFELRSN